MNLISFLFATGVLSITRDVRTWQFRFEFVTDNGSNSLRRLAMGFTSVACITKVFNDDLEKFTTGTITTYTSRTMPTYTTRTITTYSTTRTYSDNNYLHEEKFESLEIIIP